MYYPINAIKMITEKLQIEKIITERSQALVEAESQAIERVREAIETPEYRSMIHWLHARISSGSRLVITGVGKNAHIAAKISETMASLGLPSFYLNTSHAFHGDFGFLGKNDIVIHISRSGTTSEMLEAISYIKSAELATGQIVIHCNPSIARNSSVEMEICIGKIPEGDKHQLAPTASTTGLLCLLDAVASTLSELREFGRFDFLKLHPAGALGKMLADEKNKNK